MDKKIEAALKQSPGVTTQGKRIRVHFMYKGKLRVESLKGLKISVANVRFANRKRETILHEIATNCFDYAHHFPESKNALIFAGSKSVGRTIKEGVKLWLDIKRAKLATTTYSGYTAKAKYVEDWAGDRRITDITQSQLEAFQVGLIEREKLKPSTANDVLIVLRGVWRAAHVDGVITRNPMDLVENFAIEQDNQADPFTRDELNTILTAKTNRLQERNMVGFRCWVGTSASETFGLAWEDYDEARGRLLIKRALVEGEYKCPKEKVREREIELLDPAIEWLEKQRQHTQMLQPVDILVTRRDNMTYKSESIRPIFLNSLTNSVYTKSSNFDRSFLTTHLRKLGIRHRGGNQCRHTFASQCITAGIPLEWIARQLGHSDTSMLRKHYAKMIPEDTPSLAGVFSDMLGVASKGNKGIASKIV